MYKTMIQSYEDKQKSLIAENDEMRKCICTRCLCFGHSDTCAAEYRQMISEQEQLLQMRLSAPKTPARSHGIGTSLEYVSVRNTCVSHSGASMDEEYERLQERERKLERDQQKLTEEW